MTQILDPTDERIPVQRELSPRPEHITGAVALLDISKPRGDVFLDRVQQLMAERLPQVELRRYRKPTVTKPAPLELRRQIVEECGFVIEALAD